MPDDYIDLVLINYDYGGKELCFAPLSAVNVDDIVESEFGRGTVVDVVTCDKSNKIYHIADKAFHIRPVLSIINPIKYEVKK